MQFTHLHKFTLLSRSVIPIQGRVHRYLQEGFMHINTEVGRQAATQEQACGGDSDRACVTFYSCRCVNCCLAIIELLPFSFVASKLYTLIRNERGFSPAHRPFWLFLLLRRLVATVAACDLSRPLKPPPPTDCPKPRFVWRLCLLRTVKTLALFLTLLVKGLWGVWAHYKTDCIR